MVITTVQSVGGVIRSPGQSKPRRHPRLSGLQVATGNPETDTSSVFQILVLGVDPRACSALIVPPSPGLHPNTTFHLSFTEFYGVFN